MTNLSREEMRLYQQARRAKLKAESGGLPFLRAEAERARAKACGGRGFDKRPAFGNRSGAAPLAPARPQSGPQSAVYRPPQPSEIVPRQSLAIGGKPGTGRAIRGYDPTFAPLDPQAVSIHLNFANMLGALAAKADEQERRSQAQERRIAALEAEAADRHAYATEVVKVCCRTFASRSCRVSLS
jgi:hypothetical protein